MRAIIAILIIVFLCAPVIDASEQSVLFHDGFCTGQDFLEMSPSNRRIYSMGAINGILCAPFFGAPVEKMNWFESYIENMTDVQVAAILSKFLEDNPGRLHDGLYALMYSAIKVAYDESRSNR